MQKFSAIPTMYRGVQMRSRLEARWGAMLDSFNWRWEYETLDFDGWIPDFVVQTETKPLLIEVKPILAFDVELGREITRALNGSFDKYNVLIAGAGITQDDTDNGIIGWVNSEWIVDEVLGEWEPAILIDPIGKTKALGLAGGQCGSYLDRISGEHDGNHYYSPIGFSPTMDFWVKAGNAVQWRAP